MSVRDKLEVGLKPDAPYRQDNLPEFQKDDPDCEDAAEPGTGGAVDRARNGCDDPGPATSPAGNTGQTQADEDRARSRARRGPEPT